MTEMTVNNLPEACWAVEYSRDGEFMPVRVYLPIQKLVMAIERQSRVQASLFSRTKFRARGCFNKGI